MNELLEEYMPLIVKKCRPYIATASKNRIDFDDLVQIASMEFLRSVEVYDDTRGMKLSSYVARNINRTLSGEFDKVIYHVKLEDLEDNVSSEAYVPEPYQANEMAQIVLNETDDPVDKEIIRLYLKDYNWREMSDVLGISFQAVSARFHKIVDRIRSKYVHSMC